MGACPRSQCWWVGGAPKGSCLQCLCSLLRRWKFHLERHQGSLYPKLRGLKPSGGLASKRTRQVARCVACVHKMKVCKGKRLCSGEVLSFTSRDHENCFSWITVEILGACAYRESSVPAAGCSSLWSYLWLMCPCHVSGMVPSAFLLTDAVTHLLAWHPGFPCFKLGCPDAKKPWANLDIWSPSSSLSGMFYLVVASRPGQEQPFWSYCISVFCFLLLNPDFLEEL